MKINEKNKNPSSLPYGKLLKELNTDNPQFIISDVIKYALSKYKAESPLKMIFDFSSDLKNNFKKQLEVKSFQSIVEIANKMGWTIIGMPSTNDDRLNRQTRPFQGCQILSKFSKKIYLSSALSLSEARATIAHEIMHSLFATINNTRPGNLPADYIEEVLCDYGAANFLIDDNYIIDQLDNEFNPNLAERLVYIQSVQRVPRYYIAYRVFDVLSCNNIKNINSIIEWYPKDLGVKLYKLYPTWSVTSNNYIPSNCSAKEDKIIYSTFQKEGFNYANAIEKVDIAGLRGDYNVYVCAMGKLETKRRIGVSVFAD